MTVKIIKLVRGIDWIRWLCPRCVEKAEADGWEVKGRQTPRHPLQCDECGHDDAKQPTTTEAAA